MLARAIVFEDVRKVGLRDVTLPEPTERDVVVEMIASGVSAGTERWALLGKRGEMKFPHIPGYMGIGTIQRVGAAAETRGYAVGDTINFMRSRVPEPYAGNSWMATHLSHAVVDVCAADEPNDLDIMVCEKVPDGLDAADAAISQLCAVALRGIEMATVPVGATVLVIGLGLIGQFAAQVCRLKGARVAATDIVAKRLEIARSCGIEWVIDGASEHLAKRAAEIAPGGFDIIIDTSSVIPLVNSSFPLLKMRGKFVFQGWYPPPSGLDLNAMHGRLPSCYFPCAHTGPATAAAMQWIADGKLDAKSLITHRVRPQNASEIYEMLLKGTDDSLGVVFDWRSL